MSNTLHITTIQTSQAPQAFGYVFMDSYGAGYSLEWNTEKERDLAFNLNTCFDKLDEDGHSEFLYGCSAMTFNDEFIELDKLRKEHKEWT